MSEQDQKKNFTPKGSKQEEYFLEGPHSRASEFNFIIKVMREFLKGFRALHFVGPCVTVFGSARFKEDQSDGGGCFIPMGCSGPSGHAVLSVIYPNGVRLEVPSADLGLLSRLIALD